MLGAVFWLVIPVCWPAGWGVEWETDFFRRLDKGLKHPILNAAFVIIIRLSGAIRGRD